MKRYEYLSDFWKKDFANLSLAQGARLTIDDIEDWSMSNDLGLYYYQMDDLLYAPKDLVKEWSKL